MIPPITTPSGVFFPDGNPENEADAGFRHTQSAALPGVRKNTRGVAQFADDCMNLGVSATLGDAHGLHERPFSAVAQRWIFTWLLCNATW
jgi:hypothetical protein